MAEPAENLNPEPIPSEPAAQPSQGPAQEPNVQFGTFLQFGKQEYRNVTVAGIDPRSGNILAFRRSGDEIRRVLIPRADYEDALKKQKAIEKRTGQKQKAFLGRFVGTLLNRPIVHNGETAQIIGYDAQRSEALAMVNGRPQWIGAGSLLESQKNISVIQGGRPAESAEPSVAPSNAEGTPEISRLREAPLEKTPIKADETKTTGSKEKKSPTLTSEELEQAEIEAEEPEITIEELSDAEAEQITAEAEAIELQEALQNAKVVEALEGASIANVLPAPLIQSLSTPVAPGSVAEKRRDLQIEQAYQNFAKGKSPEDLAKVLGGLTQEFKQIDSSTLPEMQPLREIQAKLVTAAASDLKSKGVLLPEISTRLTGDSLQTARDLSTTIEVSGGVPVAAVLPAVAVAVSAPAASGAQAAEVLSRAQAAINILDQQITERTAASEQIRTRIGQISDKINQLNQRAASIPAGENERIVMEAEIESSEGERRSLQDQLTNVSVQLGNDRRDQTALKVGIANISQAPVGQAPPELVTDLSNKIPPRLAPQIAALPALPPVPAAPSSAIGVPAISAGAPPAPISIGAPAAPPIPVRTAPIRQVGGGALPSGPSPAPLRTGSAPAQPVRAPLRALPNVGRDSQRAAQLVSDQQEGLLDEQEAPVDEELLPDTYEQAMAEEGGVGGELSPLEIGTQMPDMTSTYAAGGNIEEGPEPADLFMERESVGRKRMADLNKQAPPKPAADTAVSAQGSARQKAPSTPPPGGAPPQPGAAGAPSARDSSRMQRLLNQQSQAIAKRDKAAGGLEQLQAAQDLQANLDSIKKLKRLYDVAKVGGVLTFWGIVVVVLTMNIQLINKYTTKIRVIPKQTLVEDLLTVVVDLLLLQVLIVTTAIMLVVPAIIAAVLAGLFTLADASGFVDLIGELF
ncbi:hypothetical protein IT407_04210 [Candidatus Uhrbacteria bacterium]|nr:hypothetical protein [Candidatus Uhrbacteria bacterium]